MSVVAALLPFVVVLALLLLRRTTLETAIAGLVTTVAIVAWRFPVSWHDLADGSRQWWGVVVEVVLILLGGLWLNQLLEAIGAHRAIAELIDDRSGAGLPAVLLVTHGIAPFAESVTGFGVGASSRSRSSATSARRHGTRRCSDSWDSSPSRGGRWVRARSSPRR